MAWLGSAETGSFTTGGNGEGWFNKVLPIVQLGGAITVAALNRNRASLNPVGGTSNPTQAVKSKAFPWMAVVIAGGVGIGFFLIGRAL